MVRRVVPLFKYHTTKVARVFLVRPPLPSLNNEVTNDGGGLSIEYGREKATNLFRVSEWISTLR